MTALAHPAAPLSLLAAPRAALWTALALALAMLVLPDCCLNGRHVAGFGMDNFGSICRAAR